MVQWNAFLFRERDSLENRVEVSMLKIKGPGIFFLESEQTKKHHVAAL